MITTLGGYGNKRAGRCLEQGHMALTPFKSLLTQRFQTKASIMGMLILTVGNGLVASGKTILLSRHNLNQPLKT